MLYEAIPLGRLAAPITNQNENAFRNGVIEKLMALLVTWAIAITIPGNPRAIPSGSATVVMIMPLLV